MVSRSPDPHPLPAILGFQIAAAGVAIKAECPKEDFLLLAEAGWESAHVRV